MAESTSPSLDRRTAMRESLAGLTAATIRLREGLDSIERQTRDNPVADYEFADYMTEEVAAALRAFEDATRGSQQRITKNALRLLRG